MENSLVPAAVNLDDGPDGGGLRAVVGTDELISLVALECS